MMQIESIFHLDECQEAVTDKEISCKSISNHTFSSSCPSFTFGSNSSTRTLFQERSSVHLVN